MQLLPYWVRWMHGSSAPFFFREAVTPLKMYIMLLILSGLLFPFMVKYSNLVSTCWKPILLKYILVSVGLYRQGTPNLPKMLLLAINLQTSVRSRFLPMYFDRVAVRLNSNWCLWDYFLCSLQWVEEKTRGRIQANCVTSISIQHLRKGGPNAVCEHLCSLQKVRMTILYMTLCPK